MLFELPVANTYTPPLAEHSECVAWFARRYHCCGLTTQTSDPLISLFNKELVLRQTTQLFDALFIFLSPLALDKTSANTHAKKKKLRHTRLIGLGVQSFIDIDGPGAIPVNGKLSG